MSAQHKMILWTWFILFFFFPLIIMLHQKNINARILHQGDLDDYKVHEIF